MKTYILKTDDYFAGLTKSYIKVGCTTRDVMCRISELQTGNHRHIYLGCEKNDCLEDVLKRALYEFRTNGGEEWFIYNEQSRKIIEKITGCKI